jgi:rhodanese-related sulfurtransferase
MSFAVTTNELSELDAPILIDVRELDEYISGHVPGAINIPLSELVGRESECGLGDTVYVICQAGGRSARACEHLSQQANLQNVTFVNVLGGTGAWIAEDKKVVVGADPV